VRINRITPRTLTLSVTLTVNHQIPVSIPLKRLDLRVCYVQEGGDMEIARIETGPLVIPKGSGRLDIPLEAEHGAYIQALRDLLASGEVVVHVTGDAEIDLKVAAFTVPIDEKTTLKSPLKLPF